MRALGLGRSSVVLLASTWGQTALGLLASVLVGRWLGPSAVGLIALNLGLAGLLMAALLPGFTRAHLKRLSEGQDAGRCVGTMLAIQSALALLLCVGVALGWAAGLRTETGTAATVFACMLAAQIAGKLGDVFLQVFIARRWVIDHGAITLCARAARVVGTVLVLALYPSVALVAATFVLESVLAAVAAAVVLATAHGVSVRAPDAATVRGYWTYARPFLVTTPIALVQDSVDRYVVGRWAGLTAAGHYHVARGLWEVLSGIVAPPGLMLFTRLSSLYAQRSPERDREARTTFFRGLDKLLFVSTAVALAFWALGGLVIVGLYGPAFADATAAFRLLILAALVGSIVNPYTLVLQAQDEVARFVPVSLFRLVFYIAALAVLVPNAATGALAPWLPSGEAGAALARLLVMLVPAWIYFRWTRTLAGIPFYPRALVYLAGFTLGAILFEATRAAIGAVSAAPELRDIVGAIVAAAAYALWLRQAHPEAAAHARYLVDVARSPLSGGV
jgi:O-antigen/teichoic acid export membrane protein